MVVYKILYQDDILLPDYLNIFIQIFDSKKRISIVISYEQFIGERNSIRKFEIIPETEEIEGKFIQTASFPTIGALDGKFVQRHTMMYGNWIGGPSAVMFRKRDLYIGLFNFSLKKYIDWDMWMRLLSVGNLYIIPRILSNRRIFIRKPTIELNSSLVRRQERIKVLKLAFQFPKEYGIYSKNQKSIYLSKAIQKLLQQSFSLVKKELMRTSIKLLKNNSQLNILSLFIKEILRLTIRHIFINNILIYKIKLPVQKIKSIPDIPWKKQFSYRSDRQSMIYNKKPIFIYGSIEVPINTLNANIRTLKGLKLMHIKNTPHYQWKKYLVKNNGNTSSYNAYRDYIQLFFPKFDLDHQKKYVVDLVKSFQIGTNSTKPIIIITYPPFRNNDSFYSICIFDGLHRAAIVKALGRKTVNCKLIQERYKFQSAFSKN